MSPKYTTKVKKLSKASMLRSGFRYCAIEPTGGYCIPFSYGGELLAYGDEGDLRLLGDVRGRIEKLARAKFYSAENLAKLVHALSFDGRVDPHVINKVTSYITKFNYDMNPSALGKYFRAKAKNNPYAVGMYVEKPKPPKALRPRLIDGIWVNRSGHLGDIPLGTMVEVANAAHRTISMADKSKSFNMGITYNLTAKNILVYLHELGHSVHTRSECDEIDACVRRHGCWDKGLTRYGQKTFYEGFAEYFVAYVAAGYELWDQFPSIFSFIDRAMDLALA
jgi:hypothetical protein